MFLTPIIALLIPIVAILALAAMVCLKLFLNYRKRKEMFAMYHQERMAAIDKGIEVPPLPEAFLGEGYAFQSRPKNHLLKGLLGLFVGIALIVALNSVRSETEGNWAFFGLIPVGIGLAHLIYYFVAGRKDTPVLKNAVPPIPQSQQPK